MINNDLHHKILTKLPYAKPFIFVDAITDVNENSISGFFRFQEDEAFYKGHFIQKPVTPGVLLLEVMGQIGLVCFGIYLLHLHESEESIFPVLTHLESDFLKVIHPGETVFVHSEKIYFRSNLLKCRIQMKDSSGDIVINTTAICTFKQEF